ncbi:MAG TPA: serine hydrolase domain-containing protein [Gemmatimonadaceae bacterium]|nr:serine hydrolase domain-containing protein [Gemmatimonadaceae bacterium]
MTAQTKLLAALSIWATPLAAQHASPYDFTRARAVIDSVMLADKIPSIAVAVAKGDKIIWEAARGYADLEKQIPATPATPYSLASISKPFTATGIMILVQKELVRLRAPVNHYLGGVKVSAREGSADGVTLQRILTHRAGLPLHYQFFYEDVRDPRPPMDSTIARYAVAVYPPGDAFQYSNLGYGLLDYVIARKSGMSYPDFMRQEVFAPLGLTSTSVGISAGAATRVAQRYDNENKPIPYYTFDHPGGSEVYSSAHDLVRFGMFHLNARVPRQRQILPKETLDEMRRDQAPAGTPGTAWGLGWSIDSSLGGVRRVTHSGGMPGVSTYLALFPEDQVVVVVLLNKSVGRATGAVLSELSATMLPRVATALQKRRAAPPPPTPAVDSAGIARVFGDWRGYVRTYADSVPVTLTIARDGSRVSWNGAAPVALADVTFQQGIFTGLGSVQLKAPDIARYAHRTLFWLRSHDGLLSGYAAAQTSTPRVYYALSSYIRLERVTP